MATSHAGAALALEQSLVGELIAPGHPDYLEARSVWNGDIDRRPALIARCRGVADVIAATRHARQHNLLTAVRGGGHAVAGYAVCDDGIVIDLSEMTSARVDPIRRTIRLEGGGLNAHLDRECQAFGLAATGGFVSHTGVGGLTLGGGIGHLMRKFGLSIDSLLSCDVVTADGEFVIASERENADLFWGLRGGGGNFGVVTSFEFALQPLGPKVYAGLMAWPMHEAPRVLRHLREFAADAPDEVGVMANLRLAPPLAVMPSALHGKPIIGLIVTYAGPADEGEAAFAPLRKGLPAPAVDAVAIKSYCAHQNMLDPAFPHGRHYYWKSHKLGVLEDSLIDVIVEHALQVTSPMSSIPIFTFGGAVARVAPESTAFAHRDASHDINIVASWLPDDPERQRHVEWVRGFFNALQPYSRGVYVNFASDDSATRLRTGAYSPTQWQRLVALKTKYDPTNLFRCNANIPPAEPS